MVEIDSEDGDGDSSDSDLDTSGSDIESGGRLPCIPHSSAVGGAAAASCVAGAWCLCRATLHCFPARLRKVNQPLTSDL